MLINPRIIFSGVDETGYSVFAHLKVGHATIAVGHIETHHDDAGKKYFTVHNVDGDRIRYLGEFYNYNHARRAVVAYAGEYLAVAVTTLANI